MNNQIEIYKSPDGATQVQVTFEEETVWLSQKMMAHLFDKDSDTVGLHLKNIFSEGELDETATTEFFSVVQIEGKRQVKREIKYYNLDAIISVGYRVNSKRGTQFRQWATQRLKDYLIQGYAINEKRLAEKQMHLETLKTGIRIVSRAIEEQAQSTDNESLTLFAAGLEMLDDYDHEALDIKGKTLREAVLPSVAEYLEVVASMRSVFSSDVFAKPKDHSFDSSVAQIGQSFGGQELYPSLEEKAATLLYLIIKNHGFVDGNKRIGAACFLYFLEKNDILFNEHHQAIISNKALATLTLFVAASKAQEMETVRKLIISILNRT
ncbi:MAG TPA: virulence protein RhuM/Fic/DOC family protein [Saprospiraceae bacterium]|nr:virulence protein RhuM/Fic/DOC family protein [Saprospiraceae bacterium]HPI08695.1 virulence protein RhuM/Fic/DOC family protein [Saprospiraceae bacterium]